ARFLALRQGRGPAVLAGGSWSLEPIWHPTLREPYLDEVRVILAETGTKPTAASIPLSYFQELARLVTATLIESGRVREEESIRYLVCAFPGGIQHDQQQESIRFSVE